MRSFAPSENSDVDHGLDAAELGAVGDCAVRGGFRQRIADDDLRCGPLGNSLDLGQARAGHDHPRRGAAGLAEIAEGGGYTQRNGAIEIGIRQNRRWATCRRAPAPHA